MIKVLHLLWNTRCNKHLLHRLVAVVYPFWITSILVISYFLNREHHLLAIGSWLVKWTRILHYLAVDICRLRIVRFLILIHVWALHYFESFSFYNVHRLFFTEIHCKLLSLTHWVIKFGIKQVILLIRNSLFLSSRRFWLWDGWVLWSQVEMLTRILNFRLPIH